MSFIIQRKPTYHVYVEEGRSLAWAHVAELPGCYAVGSSAPKAVQAIPAAIVSFLAWLRSHREPLVPEAHVSRPSVADLSIADILRQDPPTVAGSKAALFQFDKEAWSDEKLERTLRWLGYSRADLLACANGLTNAALKATQVAPGRSLWDTLWHVASAEYGYISRVVGPLERIAPITAEEPADVRERLAVTRELLVRQARLVPAEKRGEVILPTGTDRPGEPWTLPKALRRALEHELEHVREM